LTVRKGQNQGKNLQLPLRRLFYRAINVKEKGMKKKQCQSPIFPCLLFPFPPSLSTLSSDHHQISPSLPLLAPILRNGRGATGGIIAAAAAGCHVNGAAMSCCLHVQDVSGRPRASRSEKKTPRTLFTSH
jgi:hypothetical protein